LEEREERKEKEKDTIDSSRNLLRLERRTDKKLPI
jgi:hypothetical protein